MITVTHIVRAKIRGAGGRYHTAKNKHQVKVLIEGRAHLDRLANKVEAGGNQEFAAQLRRSPRFECTMPYEKWAKIAQHAA